MSDVNEFHNYYGDVRKWQDSQNDDDDLDFKELKFGFEDGDLKKQAIINFFDIPKAELLMLPKPICRLCALEIQSDEITYIYETTEDSNISLADKINACLPITVSQRDNLPKQICSNCKVKLESTYSFSQDVTSTQEKIITLQLRSTLETLKCPLCCEGCMQSIPAESENLLLDEKSHDRLWENNVKVRGDELEYSHQSSFEPSTLNEAILNNKKRGRTKEIEFVSHKQDEDPDDEFSPEKKSKIKRRGKSTRNLKPTSMECFICSSKLIDLNDALVHTLSAHCDDIHETFPCPLCQTILTSEKELTGHINSHDFYKEIDTIKCCLCDMQHLNANDLNIHLIKKHPAPLEITFSCPACELNTPQLFELVSHLVELHSNEDECYFTCLVCKLRLLGKEELKEHMTENHIVEDQSIRCAVCGQLSDNMDANVIHMVDTHCPVETHRVPSYYTCLVCSTNICSQYQLIKHTCSMVFENFDCNDCNKTFPTKSRLVLHLQTHKADLFSFKCDKCFLVLPDEYSFYNHVRFQHEREKRSECKLCKKVFKNNLGLSMHMRRHLPDRPYQCQECGKSFQSSQTLREHEVSHMKVKPFKCHICGVALSRMSRLKVHLLTHSAKQSTHTALTYKCLVCCQIFPNTTSAESHFQSHQDIKNINFEEVQLSFVFRCEFCDACFQKNTDLNFHRNESHPDPKAEDAFQCRVCGAQFSSFSRVTTHKLSHGITKDSLIVSDNQEDDKENRSFTVPQYFSCDGCDKKSLNYTYLTIHRRFQHGKGKKVFKCEFCNDKFATTWSFNHHRRTLSHYPSGGPVEIEEEKKILFCCKCEKPYIREIDLKQHEAKCGQPQAKCRRSRAKCGQADALTLPSHSSCFICEICGKTFNLQRLLDEHTDAHRGLKRFECNSCERRFTHKDGLMRHMRTHSEYDPLACEFCFKKFGDRTELNNHRRTHTGDRPFMCEMCGKRFLTQQVLRHHIRMHQGITPYRCDICSQTFRRLSSLKMHHLIHTGERPHKCSICYKRFRVKQTLLLHQKKVHPDSEIPPVQIVFEGVLIGKDAKSPVLMKNSEVSGSSQFKDDSQ